MTKNAMTFIIERRPVDALLVTAHPFCRWYEA